MRASAGNGRGEQFEPSFLATSPNNRRPAIIDPDRPDDAPISIFESGAILQFRAQERPFRRGWASRAGRRPRMVVLANGRTRAVGGADPSFSSRRARADLLRDRSLYDRGQSLFWRHEQASGEPRGVRRLSLGLEAHGSSTFRVGEKADLSPDEEARKILFGPEAR